VRNNSNIFFNIYTNVNVNIKISVIEDIVVFL